jgi:thioesterase domain-containing protein
VPLNETGTKVPIFFAFPMSLDGAATYSMLSKALGPNQPFYAFQVPNKERTPAYATSIPQIASGLIERFEEVYPNGPFILGGWSAGAIIALEMAQQLMAKGRPPLLLVPVDHAPFNTGIGVSPSYPSSLNWAIRVGALWRTRHDPEWNRLESIAGFVWHSVLALAERKLFANRKVRGNHPIQETIDAANRHDAKEGELIRILYQILTEKYKPAKYNGPTLLIISAKFRDQELKEKWKILTDEKKFTVHACFGTPENQTTHDSIILGKDVSLFANALSEQIKVCLSMLKGDQPSYGFNERNT